VVTGRAEHVGRKVGVGRSEVALAPVFGCAEGGARIGDGGQGAGAVAGQGGIPGDDAVGQMGGIGDHDRELFAGGHAHARGRQGDRPGRAVEVIEGPFHLPPLGGEGLARRIGEVEDVVPGDLLEFAQVEEQAVAIFEGEEGLLEGGSIGFEGGLAEGVEDSVRVGLRVPGGAGKPPGVPGGAEPGRGVTARSSMVVTPAPA